MFFTLKQAFNKSKVRVLQLLSKFIGCRLMQKSLANFAASHFSLLLQSSLNGMLVTYQFPVGELNPNPINLPANY